MTIKKLIQSGSEPESALELQDRMAELQSEMFRLEVSNKKLNSFLNGAGDNENSKSQLIMQNGNSESDDSGDKKELALN